MSPEISPRKSLIFQDIIILVFVSFSTSGDMLHIWNLENWLSNICENRENIFEKNWFSRDGQLIILFHSKFDLTFTWTTFYEYKSSSFDIWWPIWKIWVGGFKSPIWTPPICKKGNISRLNEIFVIFFGFHFNFELHFWYRVELWYMMNSKLVCLTLMYFSVLSSTLLKTL